MERLKKNNRRFLIFVSFLFYLGLCFYLSDVSQNFKYDSYLEAKEKISLDSYSILLERNDDKLLDNNYLLKLKDNKIYADSLTQSIFYEGNRRFVNAIIANRFNKRILLKLEIDPSVKVDPRSLSFSRAIISADITNVQLLPVFEEIETFDHNTLWSNLTYDVLLEGKLSEVLYASKI